MSESLTEVIERITGKRVFAHSRDEDNEWVDFLCDEKPVLVLDGNLCRQYRDRPSENIAELENAILANKDTQESERLKYLTRLACTVWPGDTIVAKRGNAVVVDAMHDPRFVVQLHHPKALDALEALLLRLIAKEP